MRQINQGELYDVATDVLRSNGYLMGWMTWDSEVSMMRIAYTHEGATMNLNVTGLPDDIPADVFKGFLDHMFAVEFKGQKKAKPNENVIAWLKEIRQRMVTE